LNRWIAEKKYVLPLMVVIASVLFFLLSKTGWLRFFIFYSFLIGLTVYYIFKMFPCEKERRFILILFTIALVVRILFTLAAHQYSVSRGYEGFYYTVNPIANDEYVYHSTAITIADSFKNNILFVFDKNNSPVTIIGSSHFIYNTFMGLIYFICGKNLLFAKLSNCFLGVLVVVYVFMIGIKFFGVSHAKLGALLVAIDSYAIMYSAFLYKEIFLSFVFIFFTWHFMNFAKTGKKHHVLICIIAGLIASFGRIYLGGAILFASFCFFLVFQAPIEPTKRLIYVVILILIATPIIFYFGTFAYKHIEGGIFHGGVRDSEYSNLNIRKAFSPGRLVINTARMFFSPMPWRDLSETKEPIFYAGYLGRYMWYVFIPYFALGIFCLLKNQLKLMFVPILSLFVYLLMCAIIMMSGERHHIAVMPLIFFISTVGFCQIKNHLWPVIAYLPLLILFYHFDMNTLHLFIPQIVVLGVVFFVYVNIMVQKELGFSGLIKCLKQISG